MPLISIQEMIPGVRIALWKPEETPEELLSILGNTHLYESIMTSCKTEKRKIEKLTTRILINLLQKGEAEMKYNDNGKPYLVSSSEYISVSHTQCCIAVAISSRPIGIDVERIATKVLALKEKFLSVSEISASTLANATLPKDLYSRNETKFTSIGDASIIASMPSALSIFTY